MAQNGEFCTKCEKSLIRIGSELYVLHSQFTCIKAIEWPSESECEESPLIQPLLHIETIMENEMPLFKEEPDYVEDDWSNHDDSMVDFYHSNDDENVNQPFLKVETHDTAIKELNLQPDNVNTIEISEPQTIVPKSSVDNDTAVIQNNSNKDQNEFMAKENTNNDNENIDDEEEEEDDSKDNKDHPAIVQKPHLIEKRLAQTLKRRLWKNNYDATPVQCTVDGCNKMIKRRSIYTHMATHRADNGKMECDICHDLLSGRRSLLNHFQKHFPNRRICEVCGLTLSTPQVLRKHQRKVHSMASQYTTERNVNNTLNLLMRTIEMEQQREAKKRGKPCKPLTPDELMARKEQRRIWKNMYDDELVQCDVDGCAESYKRRAKYTHMAKHKGIEFKCSFTSCNLILQSKRALDNHVRRHGTNGRISKALSKDPMERRERRRIWKNNYDDALVPCKFEGCNELIKRRAIYHHMAKHKGQSQIMICDICDSKFLFKHELRKHLKKHVKNE